MKKDKRHLFHIVNFSMTPFLIGLYLFVFALQLASYFHKGTYCGINNFIPFDIFNDTSFTYFLLVKFNQLLVYFIGLNLLFLFNFVYKYIAFFLSCIYIYLPFIYFINQWKYEIICESFYYHTLIVQEGLKKGFLLFLVSEVMLFVGFFWAFFYNGFNSNFFVFAGNFPPTGIIVIEPYHIPLYNTIILILSGIVITLGHRSLVINSLSDLVLSFFCTIFLGFLFLFLQVFEYYESYFNISDSVYSSSFFMLTGLHGSHVLVGCILLINSLILIVKGFMSTHHHLLILFSIWYWHFVDIIWIFLYLTIYIGFSCNCIY